MPLVLLSSLVLRAHLVLPSQCSCSSWGQATLLRIRGYDNERRDLIDFKTLLRIEESLGQDMHCMGVEVEFLQGRCIFLLCHPVLYNGNHDLYRTNTFRFLPPYSLLVPSYRLRPIRASSVLGNVGSAQAGSLSFA